MLYTISNIIVYVIWWSFPYSQGEILTYLVYYYSDTMYLQYACKENIKYKYTKK